MSPRVSDGTARRAVVILLMAAAIVVAAGCGGTSGAGGTDATRAAGGSARAAAPIQVANGPVVAAPGTHPLDLKLNVAADPVRVPFHVPPSAGLLFDLDTGQVLWRRNPERILPMASLTKMMTALLVTSREKPATMVKVTKQALAYQGSGMGILPKGKRVKLETLLNGLLLPSGNDAAIALAQRVSGTVPAFVRRMNDEAATLGLRCTHFTSPDGFEDAGNHTCAADLAQLTRAMLDVPRLARIVRRRQVVLPFPIKGGRVYLYNNNPLLVRGYPGTIGVKTGYTDLAGHCLVAAAERNGRRLAVILLHSPNTGDQATKLLDRGFATPAR